MARNQTARTEPRRRGEQTRLNLLEAAKAEFGRDGFAGTDTNRIARAAGYAPQTFYRWFADKTAIFLAVYRAWEDEETAMLSALFAEKAPTSKLVEAIVAHHRAYRVFRRSLRHLSLADPAVRAARAESRKRQIARIKAWAGEAAPQRLKTPEIATTLLQLERLCDALAEDEFADLGISEAAARATVAGLIERLRGEG